MVSDSTQASQDQTLYRLTAYADECFHEVGGKAALGFSTWYVPALVIVLLDSFPNISQQEIASRIIRLINRNYGSMLNRRLAEFVKVIESQPIDQESIARYITEMSARVASSDLDDWRHFLSQRQVP